jgi:hypothetical protein
VIVLLKWMNHLVLHIHTTMDVLGLMTHILVLVTIIQVLVLVLIELHVLGL